MSLCLGLAVVATCATSQAALTWQGTNNTFFQESNWVADGGGTPAANTINPNANITASTGGLILFDNSLGGTSATGIGGSVYLGTGNALQIGGGLSMITTSTNGIRHNNTTGTKTTASIIGGASGSFQFTLDIDWSLDGGSVLTLRGGEVPLNNSTLDFLDSDSILNLTNEDTAAFTSEHLSKITVNGAPAVIGVNLSVVSDGDTGVIVTVIPEPSSAALLGLGGLALVLRRRK
ncbi:PEP-CTERM sorting domain-containing protein [Oceaniferula spumae]